MGGGDVHSVYALKLYTGGGRYTHRAYIKITHPGGGGDIHNAYIKIVHLRGMIIISRRGVGVGEERYTRSEFHD